MAEERAQIAFPYYELQATGDNAGVQITAYVSTEGGDPRLPGPDEITAHLRDWLQETGAFRAVNLHRVERAQTTL